jgi:hypothetical protein
MSDDTFLVTTIALLFAGYFVHIQTIRFLHLRADSIGHGALGGIHVPHEERRFLLFNQLYPLTFGHALFLGLTTFAFVLIASSAPDPGMRMLAYGCALLAGAGALGSLVLGALHIVRIASMLRQAEAD